MTERTSELMQKALSLSEEERAELACSLIDSLEATVDEGSETAWEQEIARRIAELDSGRAKTVSWEEVRGKSPPSSRMSNKEVEFHEAASEEFEAAFDWYLERSVRAAARFERELNRAIASIAEAPQRWSTGGHGTRKFLLRRFPFAVVYRNFPPRFKC